MIHHLTHAQIDRQRWDAAVLQSNAVKLYGMSWWLDACSPGWEALIQGDYEAVMPLTTRKKLGVSYLAQPDVTQQLGVFGASVNTELVLAFLEAIPAKFKLTEICLNRSNELPEAVEGTQPLQNFELALGKQYDVLRTAYSKNLKRNLNKAAMAGFNIVPNLHGLPACIELFKAGKADIAASLPERFFDTLQRVLKACAQHAEVCILEAQHPAHGHLASAVFAIAHGRAVFLFSGNSEAGRSMLALPALIDHFITTRCQTLDVLDFEGSNDANLARFYKSFGSELSLYLFFRKNALPAPVKWLKRNT